MRIAEGWGSPETLRKARTSAFLHVDGGREYLLACTCEVPVHYVGHWTAAGVQPCKGGDCELCGAGVGTQARFVLGVIEVGSCRACVWEFGAAVARRFEELGLTGVSLRGLALRVWKNSQSSRGQTQVELDEAGTRDLCIRFGVTSTGEPDLPAGLDPADVLGRWWKSQGWD